MFRARNSMHLSAHPDDALSTVRSDDRETMPNDGSLPGVPEEREEEEAEALELVCYIFTAFMTTVESHVSGHLRSG